MYSWGLRVISAPQLSTLHMPVISALGMADAAEQLHFHVISCSDSPFLVSPLLPGTRHEPAEESSTPGDAACLPTSPAASPLLLMVCYLSLLLPKGARGRSSLGFAALLPPETGFGQLLEAMWVQYLSWACFWGKAKGVGASGTRKLPCISRCGTAGL